MSVRGARKLSAEGRTVEEVLLNLAEQFPIVHPQVFTAPEPQDGKYELNRYVNVYYNDEDVTVLDGLDTCVADGDTIVILPAMGGGESVYVVDRRR
jgi:molybdopterin synthase sulfur carrier subunit